MAYSPEQKTIALAGIFQGAALVEALASRGEYDTPVMQASLRSLFALDPETLGDIYGQPLALKRGVETLQQVLGQKSNDERSPALMRYALGALHAENLLSAQPTLLHTLRQRLLLLSSRIDNSDASTLSRQSTLDELASIYVETLGRLHFRIQVQGDSRILQQNDNAAALRALLMTCIRSAMLWRQMGGRRWHLIFTRNSTQGICQNLLQNRLVI